MTDIQEFAVRHRIEKWALAAMRPQDREGYLQMLNRNIQHDLGIGIVDKLWENPGYPVIMRLELGEHYDYEFGGYKDLSARIQMQPVQMHRMGDPYHMVQYEEIHIPHFRYFPADWICMKCGCINNGLKQLRMCPHCGAPRNAKIAMEEVRGYSQPTDNLYYVGMES